MPIKKLLKDQRGVIWTTLSLMSLPFFALLAAVIFDISRAMWLQSSLQNAADASALAGALTAEIEAVYQEPEIRRGPGGQITGISIKVDKSQSKPVILDYAKAHNEARQEFLRNGYEIMGELGEKRQIAFDMNTDYQGRVVPPNNYEVDAKIIMKTLILGPAVRLAGYSDDWSSFPIKVNGSSDAVIRNR